MGRSFPKSLCKAPDSQEDSYLQGVYSLSPPHRALSKVRDTVLADGQREALSLSLCGVPLVSVLWILHLFPCVMASIPFHPKGVCGKGLDSSLEAAPSRLPAEEGHQCCPQRHSFRVHVTVHDSISSGRWLPLGPRDPPAPGWDLGEQQLGQLPHLLPASTQHPQVCFLWNVCILLGQLDNFLTQVYGVPSWRWPFQHCRTSLCPPLSFLRPPVLWPLSLKVSFATSLLS